MHEMLNNDVQVTVCTGTQYTYSGIATSHLWDILKRLVVAPVLLYLDICNVLTLDYRYFGGSQVVRSRKQQKYAVL